jgi:hypothetical protein
MSIYGETSEGLAPEVSGGGGGGASGPGLGEKLSGASKAAKLDAPATRGHVLLGVLLCIGVICFLHLSEEPAADTPSMAAGNDGGGTAAVHYSHCSSYTAPAPPNTPPQDQYRGHMTNFMVDDMVCVDNTASSIDNCFYSDHHNCGSSEGVWVSCASTTCDTIFQAPPPPPPPTEFTGVINSLRLVSPIDGMTPAAPQIGGLLQAQVDGQWGYVCDDYFDHDNNAATVACHQLTGRQGLATHCNGAIPNLESSSTPGYGLPFSLDDVQCGSDTLLTLQQCSGMVGRENENCGATEGIFLVCGTDRCPPPPPLAGIRLTGGANAGEGILEAALASDPYTWGPVCDDYFDQDGLAASAACRQLGYPGGADASHCDVHTADSNFILDDVHCPDATAFSLAQCTYETTHNCGRSEGIWLQCNPGAACDAPPPPPAPATGPVNLQPPPPTAGPPIAGMRLNGYPWFSGLLEVTYDGLVWGPVCDDWFDVDDHQVEVVCRQLGFLDAHGGQTGKGCSTWMRDGSETGHCQADILTEQEYSPGHGFGR